MVTAAALRQWAMTTPEGQWRTRAAALAADLGSEVLPVAFDLVDESIEPLSVAFGVRLLGEVEPTRPELAYRAAGRLASAVVGFSGAAVRVPSWTSALQHLLVAVSRLPEWAGFDRLLGHASTWVDDVHVGGAVIGNGPRRVSELSGLARLDDCESVHVFVAAALREMAEDPEAREALDRLVGLTRWPSAKAMAAGQPIGPAEQSAQVRGWLRELEEARVLQELSPEELGGRLGEDEARARLACEALARKGESAQAPVVAEILESAVGAPLSPALRALAARARVRTEHGTLAERVWFARFDDREHVRATVVHALEDDEPRLRVMLDDPSAYVASWAVMGVRSLDQPAAETVSRVLALALERAGSEVAAEAVETFAQDWSERVGHQDFVRAAKANITDGRWSTQVVGALPSRPARELIEAVRAWEPTSDYEGELRAEALAACEGAR